MRDLEVCYYKGDSDEARALAMRCMDMKKQCERARKRILRLSKAFALEVRSTPGGEVIDGLYFKELPEEDWYLQRKLKQVHFANGETLYLVKPKASSEKGANLLNIMRSDAARFQESKWLLHEMNFYFETYSGNTVFYPFACVADGCIFVYALRYKDESMNAVPVPSMLRKVRKSALRKAMEARNGKGNNEILQGS